MDTVFKQALAAHQAEDLATAERLYQQVLAKNPNHLFTLANLSSLCLSQWRLEEALLLIERALAIDPNQAALHYNYGKILMQIKMPEEALKRYNQAIALDPNTAVYYSNRGIALFTLNQYEAAIADYTQAIARDANSAEFYNNRANALTHLFRIAEAIADYQRALLLNPTLADAQFNWSLLELMQGDFAEGWKRYEWRWKRAIFAVDIRETNKPLWLGSPSIAGKTLYVYCEQGLGDTLQFARYIPLLEAMGAKVIFEVQTALAALIQSVSRTAIVIARGATVPPYDYYCPLWSLPLALGTTVESIPGNTPYLSAPPEKLTAWEKRLGPKTKPRVGFCWSGSITHFNDHNRSLTLAQLLPLTALHIEPYVIQRDVRESDMADLPALIDHRAALTDFTETAALIGAMDLVISVDTSIAHLAGALGKPVWLLVPYVPDFRWFLGRSDSPWYPSMRIFRQPSPGDWATPLAEVGTALRTFA
jgi:tetratricopeptide (TPR) repeat protein